MATPLQRIPICLGLWSCLADWYWGIDGRDSSTKFYLDKMELQFLLLNSGAPPQRYIPLPSMDEAAREQFRRECQKNWSEYLYHGISPEEINELMAHSANPTELAFKIWPTTAKLKEWLEEQGYEFEIDLTPPPRENHLFFEEDHGDNYDPS